MEPTTPSGPTPGCDDPGSPSSAASKWAEGGAGSAAWSAGEVEEYLSRFRVEEVVQAAINSAIRANASDPVAHVADYLEREGLVHDEAAQRGREAEGQPHTVEHQALGTASAPEPVLADDPSEPREPSAL